MTEKIATRKAYGEALAELAPQYSELVVLDADLSAATMTSIFKKAYPDRFFDMGIAECNMQGVAAGLASCGFKPFTNTFAMFAAGRSWEQIRNSIAYPGLNVKVIGSHGGLSVGEDGATHQCIEDFALMRSIPGMMVLCPCDANEMRLATEALLQYNGPAYMRLGRLAVDVVTKNLSGYHFALGKGCVLVDGDDVTVIAVGLMVQMALEAANSFEGSATSIQVVDMHTIKPLDTELVLQCAKKTGAIVVCEEHSVMGGLGSAIAEYLSEVYPVPVIKVGVQDAFGCSGQAAQVMEKYGLTVKHIISKIYEAQIIKDAKTVEIGYN